MHQGKNANLNLQQHGAVARKMLMNISPSNTAYYVSLLAGPWSKILKWVCKKANSVNATQIMIKKI